MRQGGDEALTLVIAKIAKIAKIENARGRVEGRRQLDVHRPMVAHTLLGLPLLAKRKVCPALEALEPARVFLILAILAILAM